MWVFRIPKSHGGYPSDTCPVDLNIGRVRQARNTTPQTPILYDGDLNYVLNELEHGRLRQGWGVPDLDLNLIDRVWVENYLIACHRYWPSDRCDCSLAMGRKKILNHMTHMDIGDIIFIPKTDDEHFKVATVSERYRFDNTVATPTDFRNDFRHLIEVDLLETYPYSVDTLQASVFGAPFMHAIDPIAPHYRSYEIFQNFIDNQYL